MSWPRFEPSVFRTRVYSIAATVTYSVTCLLNATYANGDYDRCIRDASILSHGDMTTVPVVHENLVTAAQL
jgi:hypothetical protein